jgi:hypothetical protein
MPSSVVDPAVVKFIETVSNGADTVADSIAGIVVRLLGRVTSLERKLETQDSKIAKIDKLARQQPKLPRNPPPVRLETGIDMDGHPVRHEIKIRRPRGRPKGARDRFPRSRHNLGAEVSSNFVDRDWDDLGG